MSRAPPFPTRRDRSGSVSKPTISAPIPVSSTSTISTRPLQISRPPSRGTTASSNASIASSSRMPPPNSLPAGPTRPQRSELRNRSSNANITSAAYSESSERSSYRDSMSTTTTSRSDIRQRNQSTPNSARPPPQRLRSVDSNNSDATSPVALSSVISAFRVAGRERSRTNGSDDFEYYKEKQAEKEAEQLRQQRIREKAPGRRMNGKAKAGDIDAVLDQIREEWEFVIDTEFNPVDLALQLLDDSSVGKDIDSFTQTKRMLGNALKGSVDKHYQAFANATTHHSTLLNHLTVTQTQIEDTRGALVEAKEALGSKRADLVQLWSRGQALEEMMHILDQIEHLKSIPDLLETLVSEKRLLQASVLLVRSLKIINKPEMLEIGAVADIRSYLASQETALREILTDELHNHLYLKSFLCESRWAAYTPNQRAFSTVEFEKEGLKPVDTDSPRTRLTRYLHELEVRPNDPPHDLDDPNAKPELMTAGMPSLPSSSTVNPEADSFTYMENILESLAVLSRLGSALDNVAQRVAIEVFNLVEGTLEEVSERAEYGKRGSMHTILNNHARQIGVYTFVGADITAVMGSKMGGTKTYLNPSVLRLAALESMAKRVDHEVLKDFFWTLYSKMDAVAQGFRVVYEVANRIGSRHNFKDASGAKPGALFPLSDIWLSVQAEIRTLLHDYLTNEEQGAVSGRNPVSSINEILRDGRFTRDRTKAVFRFGDTDAKLMNKVLRPHEDQLHRVIKDTMPGLVQGAAEITNQTQVMLSTIGTDDRLQQAQHHRTLIEPDTFHVAVLFEPTLAFLSRVTQILPPGFEGTRDSSTVLDDFVLKFYLPQLEEKVETLFHEAVNGPDAFQPDPLSDRLAPEPLAKASTQLMALINSLCAMLQTTPFHRENYSRLILGVIVKFYKQSSNRFQELVSDHAGEVRMPLAVLWSQKGEMGHCLKELWETVDEGVGDKTEKLCRQETQMEIGFLGEGTVEKSDLLPSTRNLASLAILYRSLAWFATEITRLKSQTLEPSSPTVEEPMSAVSDVAFDDISPVPPSDGALSLPLTREMLERFQSLLETYQMLGELVMHTIRIDIRCRAMHFLNLSMRYGNYSMEQEASEPDPHIVDLNLELAECDAYISSSLPPHARNFIFVGLAEIMEHILISGARHLGLASKFGIKKMMRNILALQQAVKAITDDENSDFKRAKAYYSMYAAGPQAMLASVRKKQEFAFDDYLTMLRLQCGVELSPDNKRASAMGNRDYSMYVIDLHGLEMDNFAAL
ncbi:exocyst complex component sec8 [Cylindrobasidium torrendii FP15055 ss-10]|uniref:Exocyst complex component Sec8 n=1 Tax=Cylindrobasidium torrendii FP15055 ss-10 TaxID=1314674 RepID=A0A0D7AWM3_9AGAR|nr:exocyst complex component sec8 [Cylindrobasidium torrendii FP15055 ss-10]